jgi:hypothetical protein
MTLPNTAQGDRQASVRAVTGTALTHEGDWSALFDAAGIAPGAFNGRMMAWINLKLSAAYAEVNGAMQALAAANSAYNFSSLGAFDASTIPAAPVNITAPVISGIPTQGQTLATTNGSWSGSPLPTFTYQWKRAGSAISGATSASYVLALGDVGQVVTCTITATNGTGSASATSNSVTPAAALAISGTPSSTGTIGSAYSFTPGASGGHATYVFSLTGTLPAGLSFSTSTGAITGTPTTAQVASGLNITLTDADGLNVSLGVFSITVSAAGATAGQPIGLLLILTKAS